jgi:hypothetical protein
MPYIEFLKLSYDERQRLEKLFYAEMNTYYDKAMMYRGYKATWKECCDLRRKFAAMWERKGNYVPVDFHQRYCLI